MCLLLYPYNFILHYLILSWYQSGVLLLESFNLTHQLHGKPWKLLLHHHQTTAVIHLSLPTFHRRQRPVTNPLLQICSASARWSIDQLLAFFLQRLCHRCPRLRQHYPHCFREDLLGAGLLAASILLCLCRDKQPSVTFHAAVSLPRFLTADLLHTDL